MKLLSYALLVALAVPVGAAMPEGLHPVNTSITGTLVSYDSFPFGFPVPHWACVAHIDNGGVADVPVYVYEEKLTTQVCRKEALEETWEFEVVLWDYWCEKDICYLTEDNQRAVTAVTGKIVEEK